MTAADVHWQTAVDWVLRQHQGQLDPAQQGELRAWLQADPEHQRAYDEAQRTWLITGLVPPSAT